MTSTKLPPLSGGDIAKRVGHLPTFGGCYLQSQLARVPVPNERATRGLFILLEPKEAGPKTVGHWVLLWWQRGKVEYVDPFGEPPSLEVLAYVKRADRRAESGAAANNLTRSNVDLQSLSSDSCGWWCMYLFLQLSRGQSLQSILSRSSWDNQDENESQLAEWWDHHTK